MFLALVVCCVLLGSFPFALIVNVKSSGMSFGVTISELGLLFDNLGVVVLGLMLRGC